MIHERFGESDDGDDAVRIPRESFDAMRRDHEAMQFLRENPDVKIGVWGVGRQFYCYSRTAAGEPLGDLTDAILAYRDEVQRRKESP